MFCTFLSSFFSLLDQILFESSEEQHILKQEKKEYFMAGQTIQILLHELFMELTQNPRL